MTSSASPPVFGTASPMRGMPRDARTDIEGVSSRPVRGRAAVRVMLPRVQPIAPIRRPEPFDDPEWVFDLKYDGFRGICYLEQGRCRMISRNGNLMSRFAGLSDQIAASLDLGDAISTARSSHPTKRAGHSS